MIIKFTLDLDIDADLINKILTRAGKKSPSRAAKRMMTEWSYHEDRTLGDQKGTIIDQTKDNISLSGLDNLGEIL